MTTAKIGTRIRALRKRRGLSQEELAHLLGFNDRQTVSAIETGLRRVTAEELLLAVQSLRTPLRYFTDPFLLTDEGRFSWRLTHKGGQPDLEEAQIREYEERAGRWIAAYHDLATQLDLAAPRLRRTLGLTRQSRYEDADWAGNQFTAEFELGPRPAERLLQTMEKELGILVLMVDAPKGVSGAACRLPRLDVVLINRDEAEGRRHFDLAHELFHLLTWDAMTPEHFEPSRTITRDRAEQLADRFASAVLMPEETIMEDGAWSGHTGEALIDRLNVTAQSLRVSSSALGWRLVALDHLDQRTVRSLPQGKLRNHGQPAVSFEGTNVILRNTPPPAFSKQFLEVVGSSLERGLISMRRTATLLERSIEGVEELFAQHGLSCPVEL